MLFFHARISSDISREKLRAYQGPRTGLSYIYIYMCTYILVRTRGNLTQRGRVCVCVQKHIIENPSTRRRGLAGFAGACEGCFVVYVAGRGEITPYTTAHREEERAQRLAILEGPGQRRLHTIYRYSIRGGGGSLRVGCKGLIYINIIGIYTVVSRSGILQSTVRLSTLPTYISMAHAYRLLIFHPAFSPFPFTLVRQCRGGAH